MAGNPFEERPRVSLHSLARSLAAWTIMHPASAGLTSPPLVGRADGPETSQRQRWSRCIILLGSHRGRTYSARTAW